jgi:hypothetical protein
MSDEILKIDSSIIIPDVGDMSELQKIKLAASIIGYRELPPTIDEFLENEYYCGKFTDSLYPYWKDLMHKIFPNQIETRYPFLVLTGA